MTARAFRLFLTGVRRFVAFDLTAAILALPLATAALAVEIILRDFGQAWLLGPMLLVALGLEMAVIPSALRIPVAIWRGGAP